MKVIIRMGMVMEFIIMQMEIDMKVIMLIKKQGKGNSFLKVEVNMKDILKMEISKKWSLLFCQW